VWGRIANAKSLGWAIYAIGFAIWLFGYLSAGHAPLFDWNAVTPWWISTFVPNLEAELGMVLMVASMIPIYGGAVRKRAFAYTVLLIFVAVTLAWWWFLAWLTLHMSRGQSRR
jgi:K+-transporting ATPase A subunit